MIHPSIRNALAVLATLACSLPASADGTAAAQYLKGSLSIDVSGGDVSMQLRLPMTRATAETADKQNIPPTEVVDRLKAADKMFAFPEAAKCSSDYVAAFTVNAQGRPTKGDGNIQAMYRFHCDGPASGKLAVRIFETLPGFEELKVQVSTEKGHHGADLTPASGDVSL
ncbi:MAG: DUF2796 domain-containing protein [Betaproteobacteria bacterium]|nr:DUF2796 domain-containing protein [Betaproteobacteria bacterium]